MPHAIDQQITGAAASRDRQWLVTAQHGEARLREAATGREVAKLPWPDNRTPSALAFSADGQTVLAASADRLRRWRMSDGNPVLDRRLPAGICPRWGSHNVALSGDGSRLAASAGDGSIHVFDAADLRDVCTLCDDTPQKVSANVMALAAIDRALTAPPAELLVASERQTGLRLERDDARPVPHAPLVATEVETASMSRKDRVLRVHVAASARNWDAAIAEFESAKDEAADVSDRDDSGFDDVGLYLVLAHLEAGRPRQASAGADALLRWANAILAEPHDPRDLEPWGYDAESNWSPLDAAEQRNRVDRKKATRYARAAAAAVALFLTPGDAGRRENGLRLSERACKADEKLVRARLAWAGHLLLPGRGAEAAAVMAGVDERQLENPFAALVFGEALRLTGQVSEGNAVIEAADPTRRPSPGRGVGPARWAAEAAFRHARHSLRSRVG